MSFMAATATSPSFHLPLSHQTHTKNSPRTPYGFFSFKQPSQSTLFSNKRSSSTSIRTSTLLQASTNVEKSNLNAEICHFCELGILKNAMTLLCESPNSQLELKTYCTVLQLCAELKSLEDGRKVHSVIKSSGIIVDQVLGAKLVFMYVTCGELGEGRRIFDQIANEKVFLWNHIINEYARDKNFRESIYLYRQMKALGVEPNAYTFSCVLKCFASLESVFEGEETHGYILKLGYGTDTTIGNGLISFYSRCRNIEGARKVFDELVDRDVISWNAMITGYSLNGFTKKGLQVFSLMRFSGVDVDLATMVIVLPICTELGLLKLGRALHGYVIKSDCFDGQISFENCLLDMYAKCGDLSAAVQVFERIDRRSVVSWTSMLAGYARYKQCETAVKLFSEMEKEGIKPDLVTVTTIIHACAYNGSLENGQIVHDYVIRNGLQANSFVANALMDMYAKCGCMEDAQLVFGETLAKDVVSWNTMIGGYSKNSLPNEAFNLFLEMQHEFKPNGVTMACILPACASLSALDRGREIHSNVLRNGFLSDRHVANALVDMYVKCGALLLARLLFDAMPTKDLVSWTVMIAGYGMHGRGGDAISAFNKMRKTGIEPDGISFIAILYACSHSGLLDEGWRFYNIMKNEYKIEPSLEHYACIVDLLARAGRLTRAYKFIEGMPIEPDSTVWGALLCGCRIHRDVRLAEDVAEKIFELEPQNTGYYVLLANIYAEAKKWDEVKKLRERIGRGGLRKIPGCSWIDMQSKVHVFVAGDGSHPQAKNITLLLDRVRIRMEEEGCFPNIKYALINAGDMEKEEALCGHSEKLAMAYGILNLPSGKTVRVTKNLRVCGDCHEMARFMSKMFEKEIVLRDSNRFHHFKDGRCSCRGYW